MLREDSESPKDKDDWSLFYFFAARDPGYHKIYPKYTRQSRISDTINSLRGLFTEFKKFLLLVFRRKDN